MSLTPIQFVSALQAAGNIVVEIGLEYEITTTSVEPIAYKLLDVSKAAGPYVKVERHALANIAIACYNQWQKRLMVLSEDLIKLWKEIEEDSSFDEEFIRRTNETTRWTVERIQNGINANAMLMKSTEKLRSELFPDAFVDANLAALTKVNEAYDAGKRFLERYYIGG